MIRQSQSRCLFLATDRRLEVPHRKAVIPAKRRVAIRVNGSIPEILCPRPRPRGLFDRSIPCDLAVETIATKTDKKRISPGSTFFPASYTLNM